MKENTWMAPFIQNVQNMQIYRDSLGLWFPRAGGGGGLG